MNSVKLKKIWAGIGFRTRLTLGLSTLFALVLSFGYWSLFSEFQTELQSEFDRSLYNYATDLLQNVELNSGGQADLAYNVIFSADKVFPFPHGDTLVKIYQNQFQELFSFTSDKDSPKDLRVIRERIQRNEDNQFFDLYTASGAAWRGVLMQVDDAPVPEIYFFVAVPRTSLTNQENKFRSIFVAGQIAILILSAMMTSLLARSLLRSLEELTASIHRMPIGNTKFQFSVPERGPPEITVLANLLNQLLSRLQQSLVAHQDFVAQAAHQLKTPLTIAKGHLEQWDKDHPENADHNLKVALGEIDGMSGTISNLLTLVQIESGFQNFKTKEVNLLDLVLLEVDRLDYLARKKSLKFQIHCNEQEMGNEGWVARTDPQLLSIVLNNLLENAIKYASESPIEVKITSKVDHFHIEFSNRTDHPQESADDLKSLKEKYVRGNTPEPGQGLGLYIAYKIATLLTSQLSMRREEDTFQVHLQIPKSKS